MDFLLQEDLCDCPQKDNNQILVYSFYCHSEDLRVSAHQNKMSVRLLAIGLYNMD